MGIEFTWEGVFWFILVLVVGSFIVGFIDVYMEDRKRRREQAEREEYQRRGKTGSELDKGNT